VKDDFVVHRPPSQRMRMAHQSGVGCGGRTYVQQGFQPACGSLKKE
jgi:hypothetical protein